MRLLEEFNKHQDIFNKGFRFNPEDETFFTSDLNSFKYPLEEEYKDWKVQEINKDEYLNQRLQELGLNEEDITVELIDKDNQRYKAKVFVASKHGDIEIIQYSLRRFSYIYDVKTTSSGTVHGYCVQTRLNPSYAIFCQGKYDYVEGINTPFWHKSLIEAFENKTTIDTLVITEGQIKAFKACHDGIPTVGLTSISHFRSKRFKSLHPEILEFIRQCSVKKVVILWDGDCRNISTKHLENESELTKRPADFFKYAISIKKLLQNFFPSKVLSIYFATIKTDEINENPKGIDDLMIVKKDSKQVVKNDFINIGDLPGAHIDWINITSENGEKQMRQYFNLSFVGDFYRAHSEIIKNRNFIFYGTTYRIEKGVPIIEIDKNLKKYLRIGPDYFRLIDTGTYNNEGEKVRDDEILTPWKPAEITRDFGKDALNNVMRLDGFCNIPNNVNYKQIVDNKWNLYSDVKHDTRPGEWKTISNFIKHIFGEQYEMGLDYLQILYSKPFQKLPVLSLVSKEEGTGKSTFLKLIYMMFQNNMTFVTPDDILGTWSSHWVSKLVVASEETFFDKPVALEKIKNISTADKIMRSERFVNATLIDCFVKFVFCSNHEDDFIKLNARASRFWIIKVKPITTQDNDFEQKLQEEIPHFIHYLQHREIVHPKINRMWFSPEQIKTAAFYNIVSHSEPGIIKDLRIQFEEYFLKYRVPSLEVCVKDLKAYFGCNGNDFYLNKILMEYFTCEKMQQPSTYQFFIDNFNDPDKPNVVKGKGRYLKFLASSFITKEEKVQAEINENQMTIFDEI